MGGKTGTGRSRGKVCKSVESETDLSVPGQSEMARVISSLGRPWADGTGKGLLPLALYCSQHFLLRLHDQAAPPPTGSGLLVGFPPTPSLNWGGQNAAGGDRETRKDC